MGGAGIIDGAGVESERVIMFCWLFWGWGGFCCGEGVWRGDDEGERKGKERKGMHCSM